jgi:hypothetical protein
MELPEEVRPDKNYKFYKVGLVRGEKRKLRNFSSWKDGKVEGKLGASYVKKIIIVRHGQSESNPFEEDPFYFDPGLTAEGKKQVQGRKSERRKEKPGGQPRNFL